MHRNIALLLAVVPLAAGPRVTVSADRDLPPAARYGLDRLEQALAKSGGTGEVLVFAGIGASGPAAAELTRLHTNPPAAREALVIRKTQIQGKPALVLAGGDARGLMYAALDAAERVSWSAGPDALAAVREAEEKPYLAERSVSTYTMQRAWFESRLHDPEYWKRYFDLLAASRINAFLVIFGYENGGFMAPLYPFFFDVDGFPGVRLVGITAAQQRRNAADFQAMIRLAHERGISVTAGIWDHIYRGGVQGGGIPGASEAAGKEAPGLVAGVTTDNLSAYTKAALSRFVEVFPELDGIQFRMHDESGLKPSEMAGFWHEVFGMIHQRKPSMRVDLRAKGLPDSIIDDALANQLHIRVETKYWMEQMGLPFHPTHINRQDQTNRRHGYADLLSYPQRYTVLFRLWVGGTARLLLWADPEYARRYAASMKIYGGDSLDVNEPLATWMLGEAHDEAPLPIHEAAYRFYRYPFERYWHFFQVWGRTAYNPDTPADVWEHEFTRRFGAAGRDLMFGEHTASAILPRIVAASYRYSDFPTTRGWAEMMRGGDLPSYANEDGSDTAQFLSVREEARRLVAGGETTLRRPQETSRWFARTADNVLERVASAERQAGAHPSAEFATTTADLKILAWLARYHAARLPAGVSYSLYKQTGDPFFLDDAIAYEKEAVAAWNKMAEAGRGVYSENLAFGAHAQGFPRNWSEELAKLQTGLDALARERQSAAPAAAAKVVVAHQRAMDLGPAPGAPSPSVELLPSASPRPGQPMHVAARVTSPAGIQSVRLRYRHLTQVEDYLTLPMSLDAASSQYKAVIPGEFVVPKWDLIYYVEVVDAKGAGRNYPEFERGDPYAIIKLAR